MNKGYKGEIGMEIRKATEQDVQEIMTIYNEGIEDRIATLETEIKQINM